MIIEKSLSRIAALFILLFWASNGKAQCIGSLGDPIVNETFGAGVNRFGPQLPSGTTSSLNYIQATCPPDGYYSITNYTSGCWPFPDVNWFTLTKDHTGDTNGYFMLINASYQPSDFFIKRIAGLCQGTTYKFSSWIMNVCGNGGRMPNITFTIEKTDGTILKTFNSGDIPSKPAPEWKEYSLYFTIPVGVSDIILRMRNTAPGGVGNDLALDDITFRPVGPNIQLGIEDYTGTSASVCQSHVNNLHFFAQVENCYISTSYQWQISSDNGITWSDLPGANGTDFNITPNTAGLFLYRLAVAQAGSITNSSCRVVSPVLSIRVQTPPTLTINATICEDDTYEEHTVSGTFSDTFTIADGCDSVKILNLTVTPKKHTYVNAAVCEGEYYIAGGCPQNKPGTFTDVLQSGIGCDSIVTTYLVVHLAPKPDLGKDRNICAGSAITLNPGTFKSYLWQDGSTNPTFTADDTGLYWVAVTDNNDCSASDSLNIINIDPLPSNFLKPIDSVCLYDDLQIQSLYTFKKYEWSVGGFQSSITVDTPGYYWLRVTDSKGCVGKDTICILPKIKCIRGVFVPTAFTPNGDRKNDIFKAIVYGKLVSFNLQVYNRWGELVFQTKNIQQGWDGYYKGSLCPNAVFIWQCNYQLKGEPPGFKKGTLTLLY